jgi:hypothetical protein
MLADGRGTSTRETSLESAPITHIGIGGPFYRDAASDLGVSQGCAVFVYGLMTMFLPSGDELDVAAAEDISIHREPLPA